MAGNLTLRRLSPWMYVGFGALAFLLLHLHFRLSWEHLYGPYLYVGSPETRPILPPAFFANSQRSLLVAVIGLGVLPLALLWFRASSRRKALLGIWLGAVLSMFAVIITTPALHGGGAVWTIALVAFLVLTGFPLLVGAVCQAILEAGVAVLRGRRAAKSGAV